MKLTIRVKPKAREQRIELLEDGSYKVSVLAVAGKGRANQAVIAALAEHLHVPKVTIKIHSGHTSRTKVVEIAE